MWPVSASRRLVARVVSATANYLDQQEYGFLQPGNHDEIVFPLCRYGGADHRAVVGHRISSFNIGLGWSETLTKIPVDLLLFFLSYYLQRKWVFDVSVPKEHAEKIHG